MRCYIYNTFSTDADSARTLLNPLFRCTFLKYPLRLSLEEKYMVPAAAVNTNVKDALFMVRHLQENNFFEVNKTELRFLFAFNDKLFSSSTNSFLCYIFF